MKATSRAGLPMRIDKAGLYRLCRMLHAYLSAFAFLALIFFSVTGLLLNHPSWFWEDRGEPQTTELELPGDEIAAALGDDDPMRALAGAVARRTALRGAFRTGEMIEQEASLRFEGVTGTSDVTVDLETGATEATVARATPAAIINDLHRGKNAGAAWSLLIDVTAILTLALSLIGYVLFFSLRFRLRTSLVLTAASAGVFVGVFLLFVP